MHNASIQEKIFVCCVCVCVCVFILSVFILRLKIERLRQQAKNMREPWSKYLSSGTKRALWSKEPFRSLYFSHEVLIDQPTNQPSNQATNPTDQSSNSDSLRYYGLARNIRSASHSSLHEFGSRKAREKYYDALGLSCQVAAHNRPHAPHEWQLIAIDCN